MLFLSMTLVGFHTLSYDFSACKQWFNVSKAPSELKRYGHTAVATDDELFVISGFNGRMLKDVYKMSPGFFFKYIVLNYFFS